MLKANARRSVPPTSRTCSGSRASTRFLCWSSSTAGGSPSGSGERRVLRGDALTRARGKVRASSERSPIMFGLGYQELLIILVIVLDALRGQPPAGARQVAGLEREGVQEGRQRGQGRGHDAAARRTARRRPSSPPCSRPEPPSSRAVYSTVAMRDRADRSTIACAAGLSILTVLSRWPYRARMLYNWDAVQFALALGEYDVVKHQPHPPGYILYVALGAAGQRLDRRPGAAYVTLAIAVQRADDLRRLLLARAHLRPHRPRSPPPRCSR